MNVAIICTEGESSEPAFIKNYGRCIFGQTCPDAIIIEIPLRGNHGHTKIFDAADEAIRKESESENSFLSIIGEDGDVILKQIIICDYDKMEKHGISEEEFRKVAERRGYQVVINKPNFEFFVLAYLTNTEYALQIKPEKYEVEINKAIDVLNEKNHITKGFPNSLNIPHYSKNKYAANKFFAKLLDYNIVELDRSFCAQKSDLAKAGYTQMRDVMLEIQRYANGNYE